MSALFGGDWDGLWELILGVFAGVFAIVEGTAIVTHHMNRTLSERIRKWLGIYPVKPWRKPATVTFATLLGTAVGLFIWHILTP